ncbi:hypothetical protein KY289_000088 [Solanum tuberosum]|nr:hypothetical protein KY289_000088 [Solanum tuberosum]
MSTTAARSSPKGQSGSSWSGGIHGKKQVCPHQIVPVLTATSNRSCGYEMAPRRGQGRKNFEFGVKENPDFTPSFSENSPASSKSYSRSYFGVKVVVVVLARRGLNSLPGRR